MDGFLEALRANPGDNTTRLILADWLEEQGDPRGPLLRAWVQAGRGASMPRSVGSVRAPGNDAVRQYRALRREVSWLSEPELPAVYSALRVIVSPCDPGAYSRALAALAEAVTPLHPAYSTIRDAVTGRPTAARSRRVWPSKSGAGHWVASCDDGYGARELPGSHATWEDAAVAGIAASAGYFVRLELPAGVIL